MEMSPDFKSVCCQKAMNMSDNLIKVLVSAAYKIPHATIQSHLDRIDSVRMVDGVVKVRLKAEPQIIPVAITVH